MSDSITRQGVAVVNLLDYANKNRDEGFFSDINIVAENESIPANRLVLSCYSPYFEGMFKFLERNLAYQNIIEIETVDGKTMKTLIDFVYTGFITINTKNVEDLLAGAHYLQMREVKQFCFEFLRSHITIENSLHFIKMASMYKIEDLKKELQQYISINFKQVLEINDFKALGKEEVVSCISNVDRNQANETFIFYAITEWSNHNIEARATEFPDLFKLVRLEQVSSDFLEKVILEEKLVTNAPDCYKIALSTFRKLVKENKVAPQTSKLLSLGGKDVPPNLTVVHDLGLNKNPVVYPDLPTRQIRTQCSVELNDYIYCIGGNINKTELRGIDAVWRINIKKENTNWERVASMNKKRRAMGAAVYDDLIIVAGGADERNCLLKSTEVYQAPFNEWRSIAHMNNYRSALALVSCDGYLYALGGCGGWKQNEFFSSVERLGNLQEQWINVHQMQTPRYWLAAVNCDGAVYAIGGQANKDNSSTLKSVEKYDSTANKWTYVCDMNIGRWAHAACALDGKIYVVGGADADGNPVKEIERYDPRSDNWSIVEKTAEKLFFHSLVAV